MAEQLFRKLFYFYVDTWLMIPETLRLCKQKGTEIAMIRKANY
jgi:hypothetical protein